MKILEITNLLKDATKVKVHSKYHSDTTNQMYMIDTTAGALTSEMLGNYERYEVRDIQFKPPNIWVLSID